MHTVSMARVMLGNSPDAFGGCDEESFVKGYERGFEAGWGFGFDQGFQEAKKQGRREAGAEFAEGASKFFRFFYSSLSSAQPLQRYTRRKKAQMAYQNNPNSGSSAHQKRRQGVPAAPSPWPAFARPAGSRRPFPQ
jgi:hypothetical protein